jgi:hypothetical protein
MPMQAEAAASGREWQKCGVMTEASARIIADSITEEGHRLITFEATCWRPVLAEQNTHCVLSRNSASSRAIPVTKQLAKFQEDFAVPLVWPKEQKGMQGGSDLEGQPLAAAHTLWSNLATFVHEEISRYVERHPESDERLHKSMLNRWLEVGLWQTQIISATQWDGYFWQRCHKDAEPHIRAMAIAMKEAMDASSPLLLKPGEWHLPLWARTGGHETDWEDAASRVAASEWADGATAEEFDEAVNEIAKMCSVARCARVSYLTHDGLRDLGEDINLYTRLTSNRVGSEDPPHASPLEHIATPWADNVQHVTLPSGKTMGPLPKLGKFVGYLQLRHEVLEF